MKHCIDCPDHQLCADCAEVKIDALYSGIEKFLATVDGTNLNGTAFDDLRELIKDK